MRCSNCPSVTVAVHLLVTEILRETCPCRGKVTLPGPAPGAVVAQHANGGLSWENVLS